MVRLKQESLQVGQVYSTAGAVEYTDCTSAEPYQRVFWIWH